MPLDQQSPWSKPSLAARPAPQERYLIFDTTAGGWLAKAGSLITHRISNAQRYSRTSALAACTNALHLSHRVPGLLPVRESDAVLMIRVFRNQAPNATGWQ